MLFYLKIIEKLDEMPIFLKNFKIQDLLVCVTLVANFEVKD